LILSTYQSGKVILISPTGEGIIQLPRTFPDAMGIGFNEGRLAIASRDQVIVLADSPPLAPSYPRQPNTYDSLYLPRATYFTGRMSIHDLGWGRDGRLYAINTLCSCLSVIDDHHSFTPVWKPPFIERITPDDACHLNGLAFEDGRPRFATALGATSTRQGWRENKLRGGVLIDIESNEVIVDGLSMPHSPRIINGTLYVLNSASCELLSIDPQSGACETVARLPGFARGLAAYGDYLFIGLSHLRHDHRVFGDLPIAKARNLYCGLLCLHVPTGAIAGELRYLRSCKEIYDIQMLPGVRRPGILSTANETFRRAVSAPGLALWAPEEVENGV
jgi:uncharacterized protein (TIGR03032 family)